MGRFYLITIVFYLIFCGSSASAQNSADELFQSVIRLQISLGDGASGDAVRDALGIRALETESAKGFNADPNVLQDVFNRFQISQQQGPEFVAVGQALEAHLANLNASFNHDFLGTVNELSAEFDPIDLGPVDQLRRRLIAALKAFDEFNRQELSHYGRHYLNSRLQFSSLLAELEALQLVDPANPSQEIQPARLREFDAARGRFEEARQRFASASTQYPSAYIANCELQLHRFERQLFAFLLSKTRGALAARKNLWEMRLRLFRNEDNSLADPQSRIFQSELGRWLELIEQRNQRPGFNGLARRLYSKPNLKLTISERLANRLAGQTIAEWAHVDQVIVGTRAQGLSYTEGAVNIDFVDSPHSALVNVALSASVSSNTYSKEGRITAYTSAYGDLAAARSLTANVGSLSVYPPWASAVVRSQFHGTNSIPLIDRIALGRYSQRKSRADQVASERARQQLYERFSSETDEATRNGLEQASQLRARRSELIEVLNKFRGEFSEILAQTEDGRVAETYEMVDPFLLPRISVGSTHDELQIYGTLEGDNRLAAPTDPPASPLPVDFRMQLHESIASNAIAPLIQGRLLENWQFGNIAEALTSEDIQAIRPEEERRFAIRFMRGRPIQVEFDSNEIGVTVYGREFQREGNSYADPIMISLRFRVINDQGTLKLVRMPEPTAEFVIPAREGERSAESIAFRQFLQDNLNEVTKGDPMEEAIELPANLIPMDYIDDEQMRERLSQARLVEFTTDNGWITLGWNYESDVSYPAVRMVNTPAIWSELPHVPADETDKDASDN